jgi:hypothetical protein
MPIFGITASSNQFAKLGDFSQIATTTVGVSGVANIEFTSIPQTYTHLQIRGITRVATSANSFRMQLNSDTGSNYTRHYIFGNGSSVTASASTSQSSLTVGDTSITANIFSAFIIDILDYTNTNKNKVVRSLNGVDFNGSGSASMYTGVWLNTAAINSIKLFSNGSETIQQYSSFALYGIKG